MIKIDYIINETSLSTIETNENLIITKEVISNNHIVRVKALCNLTLVSAKINPNVKINDSDLFFLNGYQSWTDTLEADLKFKEKNVKKLPKILNNMFAFTSYGDALLYDYTNDKLHGYDVFYIKGQKELFSFNNNYHNAYLIYEINKKEKSLSLISDVKNLKLKKDEEFVLFDYHQFDSIQEGTSQLYKLYPHKSTNKIFGYTSWYNYYQNISEEIILRDLEGLDSRFNLFQIDDGYEEFVGDWKEVDAVKFPNGLKGIVDKIHEKGYQAGIWLAPFVAEEKSKLFSNHKELFKKENGEFVKCGANWSGFYALDIENEDARNYIKESLEYFIDLGFDFFKLDFLYAVSLPSYDGKTKAMVASEAYTFIKEILKDKLVLGCGAIPSNCINKFEYLRIGPDVSLIFDDVWYMKYMHRERISTKVTLQNTIYRSLFNNHFFLNDPDVFLLRSDNTKLSPKQKEALLLINSLFGSVLMTSDNINNYGEEEKSFLEKAFDVFYNSKNTMFKKDGKYILISYELNNKQFNLKYNTSKGVME